MYKSFTSRCVIFVSEMDATNAFLCFVFLILYLRRKNFEHKFNIEHNET